MSCAPRHTPRIGFCRSRRRRTVAISSDEKRIGVRFVDPDWSPEHDQEIRGHEGLGGEVVDARLDIGKRVAFIDQDVAPDADVFERDVANRDGGPRHQPFPSSAASSEGSA